MCALNFVQCMDTSCDPVPQKPSNVNNVMYLYYPLTINQVPNDVSGKWIFHFVKGVQLDDAWDSVKKIICEMVEFRGRIACALCSTCKAHPRNLDSKKGVIMIFCHACCKPVDIIRIGERLVTLLDYMSDLGHLYFKTNEQSKKGTKIHGCTNNFLYSIPTKLKPRVVDDVEMLETLHFHVPYGCNQHAAALGARYDANTKTWIAPNTTIWSKMIMYFEQQNEQKQPNQAIPSSSLLLDTTKNSISIYSLNVWLSDLFYAERMLAIFQNIEFHLPDILCLQEMTMKSVSVLCPLLESIGYITHSKMTDKLFGEMLFVNNRTLIVEPLILNDNSSSATTQISLAPFATQKRDLHLLHVKHKLSSKNFICGTFHLESGIDKKDLRLQQFQSVMQKMSNDYAKYPWLLAGDTNIGFYQDEDVERVLQRYGFHDAWEQTNRVFETRSTWNPQKNDHAKTFIANADYSVYRYDRVIYNPSFMKAQNFSLECTERIPLLGTHVSDHFAIRASMLLY